METKFNFNSAICTSRSQSERLLALGLKKETADMCHTPFRSFNGETLEYTEHYSLPLGKDIPAWSLHRLVEMMPSPIKCRNGYDYANLSVNTELVQYRFYDTDYMHDECYEHFNDGNLYENVIDCIEWLIKEGYFNKEYLEE